MTPATSPRWSAASRPQLGSKVRLQWDGARGQAMLLYPEGVLVLNPTAQAVLELCDGTRDVRSLAGELARRFDEAAAAAVPEPLADRGRRVEDDVLRFLERLDGRGWVVDAAAETTVVAGMPAPAAGEARDGR